MMIVADFLMNVNHHRNHRNRKLRIHTIQIIIIRIRMLVNVVEIVECNLQLNHQVQQQIIVRIMNPHKNPILPKWKRKKKGKI